LFNHLHWSLIIWCQYKTSTFWSSPKFKYAIVLFIFQAVIEGLFRDLRGVVSGSISKKAYMLFFDWFFPYFELVQRIIESNWEEPVCISVLRFLSEFVTNTSQRLSFDISSANGALLFQYVSRILYNLGILYLLFIQGHFLMSVKVAPSQIWPQKYKKTFLF